MGQTFVVVEEICLEVDVKFRDALPGGRIDTIVVIHPASHHYTT